MKKLLITLGLVLLLATPASAWNLFFIAQLEVVGQQEGEDIYGYKLGPDDTIVLQKNVWLIKTVGANHCFVYITDNNALALAVKDWDEFRGFGYVDAAWRVALGLSNGTLNELKYQTGAHWYTGGEWHDGTIIEWQNAGSPAIVYFTKLRGLFNLELE